MFRADQTRDLKYYLEADEITVRANKDSLQYCIFSTNKKLGGKKILNEGTLPIETVLSFKISTPIFAMYGDKTKPKQPLR